jgi:anti-sigma-K factor RskA
MIENPDKEVLAAEYVLGTLDAPERAQAHRLIESEPAFATLVRDWERRLGELNVLVTPVEPPPAILERIKMRKTNGDPIAEVLVDPPPLAEPPPVEPSASVAPAVGPPPVELPLVDLPPVDLPPVIESPTIEPVLPPRPQPRPPTVAPAVAAAASSAEIIDLSRRARRWRGIAVGIAALAAAFAGVVVVREMRPELMPPPLQPRVVEKSVEVVKIVEVPSPKPAQYVAVLQRDAASPAFLLTFDLERRTLTVRTVGAERQAGKSYELWLVSDRFASPRSLGLIGKEEFTQRPQLANYDAVTINRATYAVSVEPEGGSPTGAPTGPVLYSGKLLQATPPSISSPSP